MNGSRHARSSKLTYLKDGDADVAVVLVAQGDADALANGNGGEFLPHQVVCGGKQVTNTLSSKQARRELTAQGHVVATSADDASSVAPTNGAARRPTHELKQEAWW